MADKEKFSVPVSGQPIPRGWFARLVRFMNSLVLHGDNQYTQVNRTEAGTTVTLTPSLINELTKAAAPPSAVTITAAFDTNSVTLSVGPSSVTIVGTGSVTISGNTSTGEIEIHGATSGGGGGGSYPDWGSLVAQSIVPSWDVGTRLDRPLVRLPVGTRFERPIWDIGVRSDRPALGRWDVGTRFERPVCQGWDVGTRFERPMRASHECAR